MKIMNTINLFTVFLLATFCIIGFGFTQETFMYLAMYAGLIVSCILCIGIIIWITKNGLNPYLTVYLILALLAVLIKDRIIFIITPIVILYATVLINIKAKKNEL